MRISSQHNKIMYLASGILCFFLLAICVTNPVLAQDAPIKIYTDGYAEDDAMSFVARELIETHFDAKVELKTVDVGVAFLGAAGEENGVFLDVWLPKTHADYYKKVKDKVDNYGTIYSHASLGWAVPAAVPKDELNSFEDLKKPEVIKKLHGKIQGISPGAGEMRVSKDALKAYGLDKDYTLVTASGPAMTAALKRAIDRDEWIVATVWAPHWIWQRFDIRYLKDPKGAMGGEEHAESIANPSLKENYPKVADMLSRMHYSIDQINAMLEQAQRTSFEEAAHWFIKKHPDVIKKWLGEEA